MLAVSGEPVSGFPIPRISCMIKNEVAAIAVISAAGPAYKMPSSPKNSGSISSIGISAINWRDMDSVVALSGLPNVIHVLI